MRVTAQQAAVLIGQMSARLEEELIRAERLSAQEGRRIARQLSSGEFSSAQLARMGHPYARRHVRGGGKRRMSAPGIPYGDPAIINRQTGRFQGAWRVIPPQATGNGLHTEIVNRTPYAGLLESGTSRMIPRPIAERVLELLQPARERRLKQAIKRALRVP